MKSIIENPKISVANIFRRAGYHFDKRTGGEMAFVRNLGRNSFPRFHVFCKMDGSKLIANIHIDHKAVSYEGTNAHSGEYDSESKILNEEIMRIESSL